MSLNKKTVDDINVKGKRVLVRCDFNVPLKDGKITDETRINAALPTIQKLINDGGKVILCSHLGKVKNGPNEGESLAPVAKSLSEKLGKEVVFVSDYNVTGEAATKAVNAMKEGDVVLLQNTRFRGAEETKNGEQFSKELADLADDYVCDAFGSSHRAHASVAGVTKFISAKGGSNVVGYLMEKEIAFLGNAVENPEKNVPIAVLGGTLGAAVIYIVSTNVIAGIVPNLELANSTAPFGLAFAHMFDETIGKVIMGLMVMSCFGSLLGWQFTIAQVFKSSAEEGYFPAFFKKVTSKDAPIVGMVTITSLQTLLSLMTISPSLNKQFNVLVDLAVVTNVIPYLLSMAALPVLLKTENVPHQKYKKTVLVAFIGSVYSIYALYAAGEQAMLYGSIVTFIGWTLYGFVSYKFDLKKSQA